MYNTEMKRLAVLLLPTMLRKRVMYAFLKAALKPIEALKGTLVTWRIKTNNEMHHTGQVCYIKDILKRTFGGTFAVEDTLELGDWLLTYSETDEQIREFVPIVENEDNAEFLPTSYTLVYNEGNIDECDEAFIVYYPTEVISEATSDEHRQMQAVVDKYRLASKRALYKPLTE